MIKRFIGLLFAGLLVAFCIFSLSSCVSSEIIPESNGSITSFKLYPANGRYPDGPIRITLSNKDTGKTYALVFSRSNNYSRDIKIESGSYVVEDVELSENEYKAFFCTLDAITETYVMSDEELEKYLRSESIRNEIAEYNAVWDGDHTISATYEDYVFKNEVEIVSGESYNYYVSMVVLGTTFSSFMKSNLITIILIVSLCVAFIVYKAIKFFKRKK